MGKRNSTKRVFILLCADVIIRNDADLKQLIINETEFLAEPKSAKGCVKKLTLKYVFPTFEK
jgi:hypothetical protein